MCKTYWLSRCDQATEVETGLKVSNYIFQFEEKYKFQKHFYDELKQASILPSA